MQLSPFWEYQSWHHRRFMAQLPVPKRPKFDSGPIKAMRFAVWHDTDPTRSHAPMMCVTSDIGRSYSLVGKLLQQHKSSLGCIFSLPAPEADPLKVATLYRALLASGFPIYPARSYTKQGDFHADGWLVIGGSYDQYLAWMALGEQLAMAVFRSDSTVELRWN